jgi:hypothetical protein
MKKAKTKALRELEIMYKEMYKEATDKVETITLTLKTTFKCTHRRNMERITLALVQAGMFVNVLSAESEPYEIRVYEYQKIINIYPCKEKGPLGTGPKGASSW